MKASRILKKLNYLPRWAIYVVSLSLVGVIGPLLVYVLFHTLEKMAKDEESEAQSAASDPYAGGRTADYRDEECIVTSEDEEQVRSEWARTEASSRRAQSTSAPKDTAAGEPGDLDSVLQEVNDAMRRIRRANDRIPDPDLSARIDSIENSCGQILSILQQRPQLLPELRTFLRYYLPTTLKLLEARAKLENTANTPKAREVRTRISEAIGVIDTAFTKQVEALDEYRFIDLESEIDALRDMLRSDGLVGDESAGEEDPFAAALSQRYSKPGGTTLPSHCPLPRSAASFSPLQNLAAAGFLSLHKSS